MTLLYPSQVEPPPARRPRPWLTALALAALTAAGCAPAPPPASAPRAAGVVCASPAVTEIVFALGCGDRVVGVSDYTTYPPEACLVPSIGGLQNLNRERLLVLQPGLILAQGRRESLAAFAAASGMAYVAVKLDTMADLFDAVERIGTALGVPDRSAALAQQLRAELAAVTAPGAGARPGTRPGVLLLVGRSEGALTAMTTIGAGTFLSELVTLAGGSNIFSDAVGLYPQVSTEALLRRRPDVIIEVCLGHINSAARDRMTADWRRFPDLPAVSSGRVYCLTNDCLLVPGPRVAAAARVLSAAIRACQPAAAQQP
jgi:iron complex transport system substrate-binding protein